MREFSAVRFARVARRRPREQGVTMIELLLSLAILVMLTGFVAGGLSMGRRAFDADRINEIATETDAAIQAISSIVASALPLRVNKTNQSAIDAFDGRQEEISFVGLSEGRSLVGGPHMITVRLSGSDVVLKVSEASAEENGEAVEPLSRDIIVLQGVRVLRFGYFGRPKSSAAPGWRRGWSEERLPDLVSIGINFLDSRRDEPPVVVALRQQ
jgi:general secretion pathway protein J